VLEGSRVGSIFGVGVQVGGNDTRVAVGEGTMMVGGRVGSGNGLIGESGFIKMTRKTTSKMTVAAITTSVRMSQTDNFMNVLPDLTSADTILSV
jgi:hypothetical protein